MKLKSIEVHDIAGIRDIAINDLTGHHLFLIGGENHQGKTSLIDSIAMLICGRRGCNFPSLPIRNGADRGSIKGEFVDCSDVFGVDGITIERRVDREDDGSTSDKLVVTSDGKRIKTTQGLLDTIYKSRGFDPAVFLSLKPADKAKELAAVLGLDFAELDEIRKRKYDERTDANREVLRLKKLFESAPYHEGVPDQKVKIADLLKKRDDANKHNQKLDELRRRDSELASLETRLNQRIEELEQQLAKTRESLKETANHRSEVRDAIDWFSPEDIESINVEINEIEATNSKIDANESRKKLADSLAKAEKDAATIHSAIENLDSLKAKMMADAKFPVSGVVLSSDGIQLNNVPLEQCSTREQIAVAVQIAMRQNPGLRLLVIKNGSLLDNSYLATIEEIAKQEDFQLLVEWVTHSESDEERCQVVLQEGRLKR